MISPEVQQDLYGYIIRIFGMVLGKRRGWYISAERLAEMHAPTHLYLFHVWYLCRKCPFFGL